jgi:hypothetical protein
VLTSREEGQEYSLAEEGRLAQGTVAAFERRLHAAARHVAHLGGKDVGGEAHLLTGNASR